MAGSGAVSLTGLRALRSMVLMVLLQPSLQFTLVQRAQRAGQLQHDGDAISVQANLVAGDNTHSFHQGAPLTSLSASFSTSDSAVTLSIPQAHTRPANLGKTNSEENSQSSHRVGKTPAQSRRKPDEEAVFNWKRDGSLRLGESKQKQVAAGDKRRQQLEQSSLSDKSLDQHKSPVVHHLQDTRFTEVVQVVGLNSELAEELQVKSDKPSRAQSEREGGVPSGSEWSQRAVVEEGEWQSLQQTVAHRAADTHVSKMVLTVIGSLTAILGVCVMAAIFQCCCRRKRSTSSEEEHEEEKKSQDQKSSRSSRSSKSPSPQKEVAKDEDEDIDQGQSEQERLLDDDEGLGDFSAVQRETSILRSYRKPPPPKNRARASRVPRALKTTDPKASPNVFQELVDNERMEDSTSQTPQKASNGPTSSETTSPDMQSSMLADIDSTLAALHSTEDNSTPSPSQSADRSREPSAEKLLGTKTSTDSPQLKSPGKGSLPASPSREELAKSLALELSHSVSKEMLSKAHSKSATPKSSKETTPKSQSASASPKTTHNKNPSTSPSKDSVASSNGGASGASKSGSSTEEEKKEPGNFFAFIDPTAKDKGSEPGGKSKIPVRAASSPTQPTAPLRLSSGKDKRFPVPSVHGDQMDQLLKSLKTRLKEDEGASPKGNSSRDSPEDSTHDKDLDPQSRDRSHSDPTKQQELKRAKFHQTNL